MTLIFSGKVVGELSTGLENPTYLIHCNKTCQMVAVGNSKGPGGLVVFKVWDGLLFGKLYFVAFGLVQWYYMYCIVLKKFCSPFVLSFS